MHTRRTTSCGARPHASRFWIGVDRKVAAWLSASLCLGMSAGIAAAAGGSGPGTSAGSGPSLGTNCQGNVAPVADAGGDRTVSPGDPVEFDGSGSSDANNQIAHYLWTFGDGSSAPGATIEHTFNEAGEYAVTLTVVDTCGGTDVDEITISVPASTADASSCDNNQAPSADAGPNRQLSVGQSVSFDGTGSTDPDGSVVSYWWNFGDGDFTGWQPNAVVAHTFDAPGTYNVRLWARDNCMVFSASDTAVVTVSAANGCANNVAPTASAGADRSASTNQSLSFSATASDSDGTISSYSWSFGDGTTGSGPSVSHAWGYTGTYSVVLTVVDSCGASTSDSASVTVTSSNPCSGNQSPTANAGPDRTGTVDAAMSFSAAASSDANDNIVDYWWNFGDGQFTGWQQSETTTHAYSSAGSYNVRLWVRDACGSMSTADTAIIAVSSGTVDPCQNNTAPTANAVAVSSGTVNAAIAFDGTSSSDNGSIQSYSWNFGDGSSGNGSTTAHAYASAGTYTATLTVTDNCGASASDTVSIVIAPPNPCANNGAPIANAGADQSANVGASVSFNGSGSLDLTGSISSYSWNFGDGASASGMTASHSFASAGTYSVRLTVTDSCGLSDDDIALVTVTAVDPCANNSLPTANAGPNLQGSPNSAVSFDGSSSSDGNGEVVSYWWNFGDGASTGWQTSPTGQHAYSAAGSFTATLWVKDNCGATSAGDTAIVTIAQTNPCLNNTPPTANAGADRTAQTNVAVTFSSTGSNDPNGTIQSYQWYFGDGSSATGAATSHAYSAAGSYTVTLTVTDNCGATGSDSATVTVSAPPTAGLNADFRVYRLVSVHPTTRDEQWALVNPAGETLELGAELKFDASTSTGSIGFATWTLGDGTFETGTVVYHQYEGGGSFPVELTIFDTTWQNYDTASRTLTVAAAMSFLDSFGVADDNSNDIVAEGNTAWTCHLNGRLTTINIASPSNMTIVSSITAPSSRAIAYANGHLFLCGATAGLHIYQPTTPNPTSLGVYNTWSQDGQSARDAVGQGKVVFLAAGPAGLKLLNVTNPASPTVLGTRLLPGSASAEVVLVSGGRAYVADGASKLHIYDVSGLNVNAPSAYTPTLLKTISVGWIVHQLAITGNTLIAQANPGGMFLYDVSNAASATQIGFFDVAGDAVGQSPGGICAVGNRVYAGFGPVLGIGTSVARISIADPANPYIMEWLSVSALSVSGTNRAPILHNGVLFFANSMHRAVAIDIP